MSNFRLSPADILVNVNNRKDPVSVIKRWAMSSPYDHVFLFLGRVRIINNVEIPLLFESMGRGCCLRSLSERYEQEVVVMRLTYLCDRGRIPYVLEEAIKLASDQNSYYDYLCIVQYVLPELLCRKLDALLPGDFVLPRPLQWQRNAWQICSEAINEVFIRASLLLLYLEGVPLPGDFVTGSPLLEEVWRGKLSQELV